MSAAELEIEVEALRVVFDEAIERLKREWREQVAQFKRENIELRTALAERPPRGERGEEGAPGRDGQDGKDADPVLIEKTIREAVFARPWPTDGAAGRDGVDGKNGRDADMTEVASMIATAVFERFTKTEEYLGALVEQAVARAVAAIPKPKDGRDGADGQNGAIGPAGAPGKDIDRAEVQTMLRELVAAVPIPRDGRDGRDGVDGKAGKDAEPEYVQTLVREAVAAVPRARDGRDGVDGVNGKDGKPGRDVDPAEVEVLVRDLVAAVPRPRDGLDGEDGRSGAPGRDGRDGERGDRGSPGRDGRDGNDGRDAAQLEVLDGIHRERVYARGTFATHEGGLWRYTGIEWQCVVRGLRGAVTKQLDERTFEVRLLMSDGSEDRLKLRMNALIYRETWEPKGYDIGDCTTWDGSMWVALRAAQASDKPGDSPAWRLSVKRGRNGKSN